MKQLQYKLVEKKRKPVQKNSRLGKNNHFLSKMKWTNDNKMDDRRDMMGIPTFFEKKKNEERRKEEQESRADFCQVDTISYPSNG